MGNISVLSFDPTKNLPNYGSGGMVLTDDQFTAETLISLRDNCKRHNFEYVGYNSKMSESDCAQMLVKLKYFDDWQQRRSKIAKYYTDQLQGRVDTPGITSGTVHAWHKYVIQHKNRNELAAGLGKRGVPTKVHYEKPLYEYPIGYGNGPSPTESMSWQAGVFTSQCLSLPIYPELTDVEVEYIIDQLLDCV
jgi:dTDP-4-amino-4,6-dideoxygalactose transaminase